MENIKQRGIKRQIKEIFFIKRMNLISIPKDNKDYDYPVYVKFI